MNVSTAFFPREFGLAVRRAEDKDRKHKYTQTNIQSGWYMARSLNHMNYDVYKLPKRNKIKIYIHFVAYDLAHAVTEYQGNTVEWNWRQWANALNVSDAKNVSMAGQGRGDSRKAAIINLCRTREFVLKYSPVCWLTAIVCCGPVFSQEGWKIDPFAYSGKPHIPQTQKIFEKLGIVIITTRCHICDDIKRKSFVHTA